MKFTFLNSPKLWKDSIATGFAILAVIETVLAISLISFECLWGHLNWLTRILLIFGFFTLIVVVVFTLKYLISKRGISISIRGMTIQIKQGDIFKQNGWKVIAFNEFFDTIVDDIIIAHNTLNGIFIDKYVENLDNLQSCIQNEPEHPTLRKRSKNKKKIHPLGRIILYKDYMLLAFTHFINNEARLTQKDYEDCLRIMWTEISRTYANKPIFIPLLGSGITRFDGTPHKSKADLLKCMICTLRTSGVNINQPITILLTKEAIEEINIYEIKGVK